MKKLTILLFVVLTLPAFSQEKSENFDQAKKLSTQIILHKVEGKFQAIVDLFDSSELKKPTAKQLASSWIQIITTYGNFVKSLDFEEYIKAEGIVFHRGLQFEKKKLDLIFSINGNGKISSYRIGSYLDKSEWVAPEYAKNNTNYIKTEIKVGNQEPLLGELVTPKKEWNTIVVLVHGSGPNNMNERVGPNEIFKDLAYGLAANGIASIRYNKRTYDYPKASQKRMFDITVDDVVTKDAVQAIRLAKENGAKKVILIGHSLGGHMAPKIAAIENVDGVITLAGNASGLQDLLISQFEYLIKHDSTSGITDFQLNAIKYQIKNLTDGNFDSTTVGPTLPLGLSGKFWLNLLEYNPVETAQKQETPYLILNGERDYQVPAEEARKWKNGNNNLKSKTIIYPSLNHLFIAGEGVCIPAEYEKRSHLEKVVLTDIVAWINSL